MKVKTSITLTPDVLERLKVKAKEQRRSISSMLDWEISKVLEDPKEEAKSQHSITE